MTTEKKLRDYARAVVSAERLRDDAVLPSDFPDLTDTEFERLCEIVALYPILDLPVPDSRGYLFPKSALNYGNVHTGIIRHPEKGPIRCIRISRGLHPISLTREEALELASLLTAAAMEEA